MVVFMIHHLHIVHVTWPVATDVACSVVCAFSTWVSCAKMADPVKMQFGGLTLGSKEPCN